MHYVNIVAYSFYQTLKEIAPEHPVLTTDYEKLLASDEEVFIDDKVVLPILKALNEVGFYEHHELNWLMPKATEFVDNGRKWMHTTNTGLISASHSYIFNAPTLGDFVARIIDFSVNHNRAIELNIIPDDTFVNIVITFNNEEKNFNSGSGPLFFLAYCIQLFFGSKVMIDSFFCSEYKFDYQTYRDNIRGTMQISNDNINYLRLKADDFQIVNPDHNRYVDEQLKIMLDATKPREPTAFQMKDKVSRLIESTLTETNQSLSSDKIAAILNISNSTLCRKLDADKTSYRELVEITRRKIALEMLKDEKIKISEISDKLGYANVTAFNRAFKRWEGVTPSEYKNSFDK